MYAVEYTWIRNPTPVTTRIITADSGSSVRTHGTDSDRAPPPSSPPGIHSPTVSSALLASSFTFSPDPSSPSYDLRFVAMSCTAAIEHSNANNTVPHPTKVTNLFPSRAPNNPFSANPANGSTGMSQRSVSIGLDLSRELPLQEGHLIHVGGMAASENGDDDGEADGRLGRRHRHDEEGEDLALHPRMRARQRDEG